MVTEKAYLIINSFNLMGYDAIGIGDDDLSLGKEFLLEISKKANFPFLSSNLVDEESGKLLFPPYVLKEDQWPENRYLQPPLSGCLPGSRRSEKKGFDL